MSNLRVIKFDKSKQVDHFKEEMINMLTDLLDQVESGEISEFVAASLNTSGEVQVHAVTKDVLSGVGLYEFGKSLFIDENR